MLEQIFSFVLFLSAGGGTPPCPDTPVDEVSSATADQDLRAWPLPEDVGPVERRDSPPPSSLRPWPKRGDAGDLRAWPTDG